MLSTHFLTFNVFGIQLLSKLSCFVINFCTSIYVHKLSLLLCIFVDVIHFTFRRPSLALESRL